MGQMKYFGVNFQKKKKYSWIKIGETGVLIRDFLNINIISAFGSGPKWD